MEPIRKFLRLSSYDRQLLLRSLLLLGAIRVGLWVLPFPMLHRLLAKAAQHRPDALPEPALSERVAWAVMAASRYVPAATCLTQAMAAKMLLHHYGQPATLRIGVTKNAVGRLQAHAWVESHGKIVLGGSEAAIAHYTPLSDWDKAAP